MFKSIINIMFFVCLSFLVINSSSEAQFPTPPPNPYPIQIEVPATGCKLRRGQQPVCPQRCVQCRSACHTIPRIPTKYYLAFEGSTVTEDNPAGTRFFTNFGGNWAIFEENEWHATPEGTYHICFRARNWKHNWDRTFYLWVYY